MTIEEEIKARIEAAIAPEHLEVINESYKHHGHAGDDGSGQTHFKLIIVSNSFEGLSRVDRQKTINKLIKELFDKGLHAVSMHIKTPKEVSQK